MPSCLLPSAFITGAGRAFSAGGDVEFMRDLQTRRDVETFRKLLRVGGEIIVQIVEMPKPVIASINGVAAGAGCNLALACDYRIASDQAKLGETFVRIGLHPDWGGTFLLPRLVGRSRAMFDRPPTGAGVPRCQGRHSGTAALRHRAGAGTGGTSAPRHPAPGGRACGGYELRAMTSV